MPTEAKRENVADLADRIKRSTIAIATDFSGLGVHQLTNLAVSRFARGSTLELQQRVAEELIGHRQYVIAWELLEGAPRDAGTTAMRLRLARRWMLDSSTLDSGMGLADIARLLAPIMAPAAASETPRARADYRALLAYAQVMRAREAPVHGPRPQVRVFVRRCGSERRPGRSSSWATTAWMSTALKS